MDPCRQLGLADAGVPGVITDSMSWTSAQVTARWLSERSMSDLLLQVTARWPSEERSMR